MIVRDLFCGGGGWSVAVNDLRLPVHGYDNNADAITTYRAAGFNGTLCDLSTAVPLQCDGLVASPPCQPYSPAGKQQGRTDPRGMLPLVVAHWADIAHPTWIAVEQVQGASSVINRLAAMLVMLGYRVVLRTVDSECFGVPQTRRRIVLMAHLHKVPGVPRPTHSRYDKHHPRRLDRGMLPWVSMADALGWGMNARPATTITSGGADTGGAELFPARARATLDRERVHQRWTEQRPSPTIVGSFHPEVVAKPAYRMHTSRQNEEGSVTVTVAEAGILQGFPPHYPWTGSMTSQYRQVGNAFPPPVAQAVLEALL